MDASPVGITRYRSLLRIPDWLLAALVVGGLYALAGRLAALVPPDNAYADALWIGESSQITRHRIDGQQPPLVLAGGARALAVDPAGVIWAYGEGLRTFDFAGSALGAVATDPDDTRKAQLAINPNTGDAWLALGQRLYRYGSDLTLLGSRDLPDQAVQIAFHAATDRLWVATRSGVSIRDAAGNVLVQVPLAAQTEVRALALDGAGFAWVSDGQSLRRYSPQGALQSSLALPDVDQVATTTEQLWLFSGRRVVLVDALSGAELLAREPFVGGAAPDLLIASPVDGSAFVARNKALVKITGDGTLSPLPEQPENIRALALYADLTPPVLAFSAPAPGTLTNASQPLLTLTFSDGASGVDPATLVITADDIPLAVDCSFTASAGNCTPRAALTDGGHRLSATIADHAGNHSAPALTDVRIDTLPPVIEFDFAPGPVLTNNPAFTLSGLVSEPAGLELDGAPLALDAALRFRHSLTLAEGDNRYQITATDRAGNTGTATVQIVLDTLPPPLPEPTRIDLATTDGATVTLTGQAGSVEPGSTLTVTNSRTGATATAMANPDGGFVVAIAAELGDLLELQLRDAAGNQSAIQPFTVASPVGDLPVDPQTVATPLAQTAITPFVDSTQFLYRGPAPIQTGVAEGTMDPLRTAVIRGRVIDRANQALPGVSIAVAGHPEYGQTQSRADGAFDLVVNGGGTLTLAYAKPGYLPVQRQLETPWLDYVAAPEIVLTALDPRVTAVDLAADVPLQVAQGSPVTDADGSRQASVFFPSGTTAILTLPDGSTQPLTNLLVRATEYTVGDRGPQAMPGPLPPSSGYTYAVELSVDQAIAAGATRVDFSQPLPVYVDNFLGFPVGEVVPLGWYDREKTAWMPADNGRVIALLGVDSTGRAELDIDGSGAPADETALAALGIADAERVELARRYAVGKTLWRVQVTHFTPWDCNWPWGLPPDSVPPPVSPNPAEPPPDKDSDSCKGCTINAQARTMGEELAVNGTPYQLHYQSRRAAGHTASRSLEVRISGDSIPASLQGIDLTVAIAGQVFSQSFPAARNQSYTFVWDGLDGYGRPVTGTAEAKVTLGYRYNLVYYRARADLERSFAAASAAPGTPFIGRRGVTTSALARSWTQPLDGHQAPAVGNWSFDQHHAYDVKHGILELGTGVRHGATTQGAQVTTVAGDGTPIALEAPQDVAVGADGSLYFADVNRIHKITPDGRPVVLAGTGVSGYDDQPLATQAKLAGPRGIAVAADGTIYVADSDNHMIRKITLDGRITRIAGSAGSSGYSGDGGPALLATLNHPGSLALAPDGSLYFTDSDNDVVRRIGPDGIITTVAGNGTYGFAGDGGPATQASFRLPAGVAIGKDGSLYITDYHNNRIRRVGPDGIVATVASGLPYLHRMAVSSAGEIYFSDHDSIGRIGPEGISQIAGSSEGYAGDGGPALAARFNIPLGIAFDAAGRLYVADSVNDRIRQIALPAIPYGNDNVRVPAPTGGELYEFDRSGRHLQTLNALTGATTHRFRYDAAGLLTEITDGDDNTTRIERTAQGDPLAIVAPDGERTQLTVDAAGHLTAVSNPAGETYAIAYTDTGLLTTFADPKGQTSSYTYDSTGLLTRDLNAGGGGWTLDTGVADSGYTNRLISGEGRVRTFAVDRTPTRNRVHTNTGPDGTVTSTLFTPGSYTTVRTAADGTVTTTVEGSDPRFAMLAPITKTHAVALPSGLRATTTLARTLVIPDPRDVLRFTSLTETRTVNGKVSTQVFDRGALTWTTTSPVGRVGTTTIDPQGRPVHQAIPGLAPVTRTYDSRGRLVAITQSDGATTRSSSYRYHDTGPGRGLLSSLIDSLGREYRFEYDAAGRITAEILPDGAIIAYTYDANGNLASIAPPGQPPHRFEYTALDQTQAYDPPSVATFDPATHYTYNRDRQLKRIRRPDGQGIDLGYDTGGRTSTLVTPTRSLSFAYTSAGQLRSVAAASGITHDYTWDGFLPKGETLTGPVTGSLNRTYNSDFNLTGLSVNGSNVAFAYDDDGLLTQAGALSLARDPQHGLLTGTVLGSLTTTQRYNAFAEPAAFSADYAGTELLDDRYGYDDLGRIVQRTETLAGVTTGYAYNYDPAGRLQTVTRNGVTVESYAYDANGNRLTGNGTAATHDAQDRLLSYGNNTYTYTANGEWQTKTTGTQTTHYTYDVQGNLTQAVLPDGRVLDYLIDGHNRRIGKLVNGVRVQGFLWQDALRIAAELDAGNTIVSRFVYGTKVNVPEYLVKGGITYRLLTDHLGSVRLVVDTTDGRIVQRIDYDSFGNVTLDTNPGFQPFGFAGGLYDRDTKLTRFGARDYDAETGRWTAKDPIGFAGGDANQYGYVGGNPQSRIDPSGLDTIMAHNGTATYYNSAGQAVGTYQYTTGRPDVTDTTIVGQGPIPLGTYTADPSQISKGGFFRNLLGDWGRFRVPLKPDPGTKTFGRDGFFLHGGKKPGSAGCIDVGSSDTDLFGHLRDATGLVPVVIY